jgi:NTP pyrophosphatase (non-canonical NTP hydrolase)
VPQDPQHPERVSPGSTTAGARLLDLVAVMDRLRTECPWDAKQTHESLAPYLLEETYEALEALESGNPAALREELGDVLLQVLFHSRVAAERADGTGYTIDDVAEGIASKLVRRHPHVFGDVTVAGAGEVKQNWDAIKAAEREAAGGGPGSALDGVPFGQPALSLATQLQRRAERAGIPDELADLSDLPNLSGSADPPSRVARSRSRPRFHDLVNNAAETGPDLTSYSAGPPVSEIGAQLFALVARAAEAGLDPELELRAAARAYRDRVQAWEQDREP